MKLDRKDVHDRFKHFTRQNFSISECCQDLIDMRPFGEHAFYIFAHARTDDDGTTKRMIWQPRLTKPKAQTNSMLFKAYPGKDTVKIIWIIPAREMWAQYECGLITENATVVESIHDFLHNRQKLERKEDDDLDDRTIDAIYSQLKFEAINAQMMKNSYKHVQNKEDDFIDFLNKNHRRNYENE